MRAWTLAWLILAAVQDPADRLKVLEERLVKSPTFKLVCKAVSEGAVESSLTATLHIETGNRVHLSATGKFQGQGVSFQLVSDGKRMRLSGPKVKEFATPAGLNEGLLIGLVRMGILHNLAMMSTGSPPQWTDGTVKDKLQVAGVTMMSDEVDKAETFKFGYKLEVAGRPSATGEFWLLEKTGLPLQRKLIVKMGDGEMKVTEMYKVTLDEKPDPARFELSK